jgi:hypothetical protein
MTKIYWCFAANGTRPPTALASRSTNYANPRSNRPRWADNEHGRRGAASVMPAQHAKWSLLILYALPDFL